MDHIQKHRDEQNARIAGSYNQPTPFEKAIAEVADSLEKAEGARGGRVIGHTKSGKPIYESHNHESHNNFNEQDHRDASVLQSKRAQEAYTEKYKKGIQEHLKNGKNHGEDYHDSLEAGAKRFGYDEEINKHAVAHMKAANKIQKQDDKSPNHYDPSEGEKQIRDRNVRKSEEDIELRKSELENEIGRLGTTIQSRKPTLFEKGEQDELEKGGEGSRGGKIIGHTRSGKPIYNQVNHSEHKSFTKEDHEDAAKLHDQKYDYYLAKDAENHHKLGGEISEKTEFHSTQRDEHEKLADSNSEAVDKQALINKFGITSKEKEADKKTRENLKKSEQGWVELRKSELNEEIGRLGTTIQSRINVDNGAPDSITKSMQIDLVKAKRQLAYIRQYGQIPS